MTITFQKIIIFTLFAFMAIGILSGGPALAGDSPQIHYGKVKIDGTGIFYREAGDKANPAIVLLHGFPTSSHMFRDLIPQLAKDYYVIAPDYPGFGNSDAPSRTEFSYTFDNFAHHIDGLLTALKVDEFSIYVFDYGAPVGFRLYQQNPARITSIIAQNGNAYDEGIAGFWDPIKAYWKSHATSEREAIRWLTTITATKWQYENGVPADRLSLISPDGWQHTQSMLDREGNADIQLDIFYDYRNNIPLYPQWQEIFRKQQTPLLVIWGKNDEIFVAAGGEAYRKDLPNAEIHMLDTGHFALETHGQEIGKLMKVFLANNTK
ncbi:MAG: alpha/beta hydrolase [Alphaproteobacteria bacterium]|nr:MAG: alpha/beta hydrolase [Alphaproteobacteria bacterium]